MKDIHGNNHYAIPPFQDHAAIVEAMRDVNPGRGVIGADANDGEASEQTVEARLYSAFHGDFSATECDEIVEWMRGERIIEPNRDMLGTGVHSKLMLSIIGILEFIWKKHPSPSTYAILASFDLDFLDDIYSHRNQSEVAEVLNVTKAAVNKAVKEVQEKFKLEPRRDQRKAESCKKMKQKRINQLK
jgi:hypothetical protein